VPFGVDRNRDTDADQKYITCNADEGDSGTFSDRILMEGDPLGLIEGMAIAGFGIGFNQRCIGDNDARVMRVFSSVPLPSLPVWLTAHAELKTSRRVRIVFDFLSHELGKIV